MGRFAEQQSRWGFVPGDEDTLNINMDVPGGLGLGSTTFIEYQMLGMAVAVLHAASVLLQELSFVCGLRPPTGYIYSAQQ
jgi:hypothetical protein